jgi:hypothetical protein
MSDILLSPSSTLDPDDTEAVLVEAQGFSEDEEILKEDALSDFTFDDYEEENESFEDDDDMLNTVRLHDLNTLRHLYRFGLVKTAGREFAIFFVADFQVIRLGFHLQMS